MQVIANLLSKGFGFLFKQFNPLTIACIALIPVFALLIGGVLNPQGWMNSLICGIIDMIAFFFPASPEYLKISSILNGIGDSIPLVGRRLVYDIASTFAVVVGLFTIIKIYKLLPFKAS